MNWELPDVQAGFRKAEEPEIKLTTPAGSQKKQGDSSKEMLKILHASLQHYINQELQDIQAGFRKAEEPEIKLPTSVGS